MDTIYLLPGEERCVDFRDANGVPKVHYTYCSFRGRLFNCTCCTKDEAQRLCEDWLIKQDRCYINKLKNAEGSSHMGRDSSAFFISCFLIARSTVSRALLQCTDHSHCFSTSFSLFKSSGLAICSFMPVFFASCTSSAKAFAVMAMMGTLPRLPASARIAAVAS